jgi:DNA-binding response OmpR family regulator
LAGIPPAASPGYTEFFRKEMTQATRILIVGPDDDERGAISKALARDFEILDTADFKRAYDLLLESQFDLVLVRGAGWPQDGVEFIQRVRAAEPLTAILILVMAEWGTGEPTLALSAGADAYEPHGPAAIDQQRLKTSIERLLSRQAAAAN